MNKFIQGTLTFFFLIFAWIPVFSVDISNSYSGVSKAFDVFVQKNEGETAFRTLLIPSGGRFEGLGAAFTALSNDISFFDANPAASAFLKNTEINVLHNSWIADSKLETIGYTQRNDNFGWGTSLRCFYIPFTEYGTVGEKKSSGFYSETFLTLNFAYNFLAGYNFKGLTIGGNLKMGIRSIPPIAGITEEAPSKTHTSAQNGYAVLGDLGIIMRANVLKKFYDFEPNFHFGIMFKNFGTPIRGDIPPAYVSMGFAYKPVSIFLFTVDLQQPVNLKNIKASGFPSASTGMMFSITKYFNLLTGFGIRGGNPRFSLGGEVNLSNITINANYTLDLASQTTNLNRISVGVKILLGDGGREKRRNKVENLYMQGLNEYRKKNYEAAITIWKDVLTMDKTFDPAIEGIEVAEKQKKLQEELNKILLLEKNQ
ncbi:UPF0164 family protein [Treponema pedis]|uniref:UPF0164 family protein n=1 Tax=Treponema pedis TaxID=409322 RepID=UPI0003FC58D5|nr:UPF0164 family protein [Treponema pedis]